MVEDEIQPLIVPAVIEHQELYSDPASSQAQPNTAANLAPNMHNDTGVYIDPKEALNKLLHLLNRLNSIFQKHGLDQQLICRIFKETFYFISAGSLNTLLLRKDMCHWSKGLQIRYNVAQLEQWARDAKVAKTQDSDKEETLEALHPIIQAAVLLQVNYFYIF